MTVDTPLLSLGVAAVELRVQLHVLQDLANRGLIPVRKAGRWRLIDPAHLESIRDLLRQRGRLPAAGDSHTR
jgi:hypothetical protein